MIDYFLPGLEVFFFPLTRESESALIVFRSQLGNHSSSLLWEWSPSEETSFVLSKLFCMPIFGKKVHIIYVIHRHMSECIVVTIYGKLIRALQILGPGVCTCSGEIISMHTVCANSYYWVIFLKLGVLDAGDLPIAGREVAQKVLHPFGMPSNTLMQRWSESEGKSLE